MHDEVFDLFAALEANDEQLDFPTLFSSAKNGWAAAAPEGPQDDMAPLFGLIVRHVPAPKVNPDGPFQLLATTLEADPYLGRVLTGRIASGVIKQNTTIQALSREGKKLEETRITKLLSFRGLDRVPVDEAHAGDIVAIAGFQSATVADTLCDKAVNEPIDSQPIDPPTLAMTFSINDSPLAGTEGEKVTSRVIFDRLTQEAEGDRACASPPSAKCRGGCAASGPRVPTWPVSLRRASRQAQATLT